jgi:hypothetical protein
LRVPDQVADRVGRLVEEGFYPYHQLVSNSKSGSIKIDLGKLTHHRKPNQ